MAGIQFEFEDFKQLLRLNIGISERLDENRAESFTILYCDFSQENSKKIKTFLKKILRSSDAIVHFGGDYFFVLPYTDKYGAEAVKKQFDKSFEKYLNSFLVSYPVDGDDADELLDLLQNSAKFFCKKDLDYLDILK